jgi:ClpP class serine protease
MVMQMLQNAQAGITGGEEIVDSIPQVCNTSIYPISEFGIAASPEDAPENSIALINIVGAITKYENCGNPGMDTKLNLYQRALANPKIKGVLLLTDSGGGDGAATEAFANAIYNAQKPTVACVNGIAASACYKIIAGCHAIVMVGKSSEVGSIGAYVGWTDLSKHYEKLGIKINRLYAPQSTLKNKAWEDMIKGDNEAMLADLQQYTDFFINDVARMRQGKLSGNAAIFKGAMFYTEDAVKNGLADYEGDVEFAANLIDQLAATSGTKNNSHTQNANMKTKIMAGLTALATFFGLESGKDHEVELSQDQLEKLNTELGTLQAAKADKAKAEKDLSDAQAAHSTALQSKDGEISRLTTELKAANEKVAKLPGNAGAAPEASGKPEGETKPDENQFHSEADAKLKAAHEAVYGKTEEEKK